MDYRNKRVGFIQNRRIEIDDNSTFGISYLPFGNKLLVSSIYNGSDPEQKGIRLGDEIYSINGINIVDLQSDIFCKIYRNEYQLVNAKDSLLSIEIAKNDSIIKHNFQKHNLFDN